MLETRRQEAVDKAASEVTARALAEAERKAAERRAAAEEALRVANKGQTNYYASVDPSVAWKPRDKAALKSRQAAAVSRVALWAIPPTGRAVLNYPWPGSKPAMAPPSTP